MACFQKEVSGYYWPTQADTTVILRQLDNSVMPGDVTIIIAKCEGGKKPLQTSDEKVG